MATVSITIPDALIPRIKEAARYLYPQYAELSDVAVFKTVTADQWRSILSTYEGRLATNQASTDAANIG